MAANPMAAMMNMMNPQMMMQMQKMMQSQGMQMPAGMNFQQMQKNMVYTHPVYICTNVLHL